MRKGILLATCLVGVGFAFSGALADGFADQFDDPPDGAGWRVSDYAHPGGWMHTRWDPDNVIWNGRDQLEIALAPDAAEAGKAFVSGETRRRARTYYGRYEVVMQPAAGEGLNSAFFTYTGPHLGDPHDEIDFEFLGRDTTKVWLNTYVDGVAQNGAIIDLGFDAAAAAHHYAFEWTEDAIRWYVDGRLVHETDAVSPRPSTPSQIYLSLWAGSPAWLGRATPDMRARAIYRCVAFSPTLEGGPSCPRPGSS